jgi:hypothetical protein
MEYLTGLWARYSSGTVGISLLQVHLPTLCLVKVQQRSVYNKCPFFISTSTRSLPIPPAQRSPSGKTMKKFQKVSLFQSVFHARGTLETRPVRTYLAVWALASPWNPGMYICTRMYASLYHPSQNHNIS